MFYFIKEISNWKEIYDDKQRLEYECNILKEKDATTISEDEFRKKYTLDKWRRYIYYSEVTYRDHVYKCSKRFNVEADASTFHLAGGSLHVSTAQDLIKHLKNVCLEVAEKIPIKKLSKETKIYIKYVIACVKTIVMKLRSKSLLASDIEHIIKEVINILLSLSSEFIIRANGNTIKNIMKVQISRLLILNAMLTNGDVFESLKEVEANLSNYTGADHALSADKNIQRAVEEISETAERYPIVADVIKEITKMLGTNKIKGAADEHSNDKATKALKKANNKLNYLLYIAYGIIIVLVIIIIIACFHANKNIEFKLQYTSKRPKERFWQRLC